MWQVLEVAKPKSGAMVEVTLAGQELLVANIDSRLFCADNCCPHEGVKLTLGCFVGTKLKCSLHGFSFDLDNKGKSDEDLVGDLAVYPIKEENEQIFIEI